MRSIHEIAAELRERTVFVPEAIEVQAHSNVLAATTFLQGIPVEELEAHELDVSDPDHELLVTIRAVRGSQPSPRLARL